MAKIKNDPNRYVRRSALAGRRTACVEDKGDQQARKKERDFLTAPIDDGLYIDFRTKPERGEF
ncbi:hypothetical protein [Microvirga sp. Mcv34]|jgi:hypothetical protein|uniref:hypothetical protein n=1 Tax=Microvirga sp. Mcv34 TaxID=2926016 RepID=UPI0021C8A361|nr:hypothetical protein [Microvirga sp. Mcv34]